MSINASVLLVHMTVTDTIEMNRVLSYIRHFLLEMAKNNLLFA